MRVSDRSLTLAAFLAATAIFLIAPAASAASLTYCSDGDGTICQISDVTIDSNTYNVTFSFTPDFSLETDPSGAVAAISAALDSNSCQYCVVGVNNATYDSVPSTSESAFYTSIDYFFVAGPGANDFYYALEYVENAENGGAAYYWGYTDNNCSGCGNPYGPPPESL